jgi:hypothetical protein
MSSASQQCAEAEAGFRLEVLRAADQEMFGIHGGAVPMRPVLSILAEFMQEKVNRPIMEGGDCGKAVQAAYELRDVLSTLVDVGYAELAVPLETIKGRLSRLHEASRNRLMQIYLDPATPPEEAEEIKETLIDVAEHGGWDSMLEDMDNMLWDAAEAKIAELREELRQARASHA